jgi:hypothetical protein
VECCNRDSEAAVFPHRYKQSRGSYLLMFQTQSSGLFCLHYW